MSDVEQATYRLLIETYLMLDDGDRRVLRTFDLTNRQYQALLLLPPGQRRYLTEMSNLLLCDKSNITGLVERMVRDGLISRVRSEEDRRYLEIHATDEGIRLRNEAQTAHGRSIEARFESLTDAEQETLHRLLRKLAKGLREQLDAGAER